jgi:hypothetical protein
MNYTSAYHQLGQFIVMFQQVEAEINNLIVLMADADDEIVRILINDLEYGKRLNTADVLFARFVDIRNNTEAEAKEEFHDLIVKLSKLGTRRNDFVHSRYNRWINVHGKEGLLRTNSKLRGSKGERHEKEEELQPEAFENDLQHLAEVGNELNEFRLRIINWLYPD